MATQHQSALIGKHIEIPVHYDLWMRGARTGRVTGWRSGKSGTSAYYTVRMDHPQVKRTLRLWAHDVEYTKTIA